MLRTASVQAHRLRLLARTIMVLLNVLHLAVAILMRTATLVHALKMAIWIANANKPEFVLALHKARMDKDLI